MKRWIFTYPDAFEAGPGVAGGKGWNLARLDRYGFPVPPGCILSVDLARELMERAGCRVGSRWPVALAGPGPAGHAGAAPDVPARGESTPPLVERKREGGPAWDPQSALVEHGAVDRHGDRLHITEKSRLRVETGGYLSHGAIVAHEFGLTAVVNIPGILSSLEDGEILHVNGDSGIIARSVGPSEVSSAPADASFPGTVEP